MEFRHLEQIVMMRLNVMLQHQARHVEDFSYPGRTMDVKEMIGWRSRSNVCWLIDLILLVDRSHSAGWAV
jgi:hypothetical protein